MRIEIHIYQVPNYTHSNYVLFYLEKHKHNARTFLLKKMKFKFVILLPISSLSAS